ncbi:MAG: von Willebrand factor type A domain-containing protein [Alphaproteobacteria bacterium]|nr:von Willebrand factor type A domain-containing protein [Alphaproteobacteria bacterium]
MPSREERPLPDSSGPRPDPRLAVTLVGGAALLTLAGVALAGVGVAVGVFPEPEPIEVMEIPARFVEVLLERSEDPTPPSAKGVVWPPPSKPVEKPAEALTHEEVPEATGAGPETEPAAPPSPEQVQQESKLLLALIGTRGEGSTAEDIFSDQDASARSLDEALSRVQGAEVGSANMTVREGQGRRSHGDASIGDLRVEAIASSSGSPLRTGAPSTRVGASPPALRESASAERYVDYGVNEMVLVEQDRLSTFAVDVDTASYAIVRRKLQDGMPVPPSAVRVEEFVNAFDYGYARPPADSGAPFAVHLEAAPSPWRTDRHLLRVGVQGREVPAAERPPLRLTFLVDVSGSMSSFDKIGLVRESLSLLVDQLGPEDSVAVVTYAGRTEVVLEPTSALNKYTIQDAIRRLQTGGGTAMGSGVELAYDLAMQGYVPGAENRVIVLSDGDANIGHTSHEGILRTITAYSQRGITLSTVGFGMGNYQDVMMEQLANKGDGNYSYIDSLQEARAVFVEGLTRTALTIARDVKIQVEFNPQAVIAYRLVGYENRDIADRDFRVDAVDAGEIGSGHSVTAVYELVLKDRPAAELATVRLRAKPPGPDAPAKEWSTVFQRSNMRSEWQEASRSYRLAAAVAAFAEKLRGSPHVLELSWAQVRDLAEDAVRPGVAREAELLTLIDRAARR